METCELSCVKYALFAFNVVFALLGIALITVGVVFYDQLDEYSSFLEEKLSLPQIVLIAVGGTIFFIAFFGCCGALAENRCLLGLYTSLLLIIFFLGLALGVAVFILLNAFSDFVKKNMQVSLEQYLTNNDYKKTWDYVQRTFECCGIDGPKDWTTFGLIVPESCCKPGSFTLLGGCTEFQSYKLGCVTQMEDLGTLAGTVLGAVAFGIAVVQLIGLILAFCLISAIRSGNPGQYAV